MSFMIEPPFCGELFVDDKRLPFNQSFYINVTKDKYNNIRLYLFSAPPPFTMDAMVGEYGVKWKIKKVKRRLLVNQYLLTLIDNQIEVSCSTAHNFGDLMEKALIKWINP
jgi:hypothetical protein